MQHALKGQSAKIFSNVCLFDTEYKTAILSIETDRTIGLVPDVNSIDRIANVWQECSAMVNFTFLHVECVVIVIILKTKNRMT